MEFNKTLPSHRNEYQVYSKTYICLRFQTTKGIYTHSTGYAIQVMCFVIKVHTTSTHFVASLYFITLAKINSHWWKYSNCAQL